MADQAMQRLLDELDNIKRALDEAHDAYLAAVSLALHALVRSGHSRGEIASLLEISPQRVSQILGRIRDL